MESDFRSWDSGRMHNHEVAPMLIFVPTAMGMHISSNQIHFIVYVFVIDKYDFLCDMLHQLINQLFCLTYP